MVEVAYRIRVTVQDLDDSFIYDDTLTVMAENPQRALVRAQQVLTSHIQDVVSDSTALD